MKNHSCYILNVAKLFQNMLKILIIFAKSCEGIHTLRSVGNISKHVITNINHALHTHIPGVFTLLMSD